MTLCYLLFCRQAIASWIQRGDTHDAVVLMQVVGEWHKAVLRVQHRSQRLQGVDDAMRSVLSYFAETESDLVLSNAFGAWKHSIMDKRRYAQVRATGCAPEWSELRMSICGAFGTSIGTIISTESCSSDDTSVVIKQSQVTPLIDKYSFFH